MMKLSFFAKQKAHIVLTKTVGQLLWNQLRPQNDSICNDLVPTADLWPKVEGYHIRDLGLQDIPMDRIVGSSRAHDFDLQFKPSPGKDDHRYRSINSLVLKGKKLSTPLVLKVQNSYFVVDGNHRISAARRLGKDHIRASVTELEVEKLREEPSCSRLGFRLEPTAEGREKNGCSREEAVAS